MTTPSVAQTSLDGKTLDWLKGMVESALNLVFSLTHAAGRYRDMVRTLGLMLLYLYWVLTLYDIDGWINLFNGLYAEPFNPSVFLIRFMTLLISIFLHPEVLRHMLAVVAPYMLVHRLASVYLADIFEKDTQVASRFIKQAAFAQDYLTIRIRAGRLSGLKTGLGLAFLLGLAALIPILLDFRRLPFTHSTNAYGSLFIITGVFLILLLISALVANAIAQVWAWKGSYSAEDHPFAANTILYWYGVAAMWLVGFGVLYLAPYLVAA